ncbi:Phytochelatin synthase-domain-containing protein [Gongronella butleri]|nr:Phytochelatin synthase-domain-containing protein [Gongronella butleri]
MLNRLPINRMTRSMTTVIERSAWPNMAPMAAAGPMAPSTRQSTLIDYASPEGKSLFSNAMKQGHAESFFTLMGNFSAQSVPHLSGLSALSMALNALEIDPKSTWKGVWRWFSSDLLKPCSPNDQLAQRGVSFEEFACLAQTYCNVQATRAQGDGYALFLRSLERVTANPSAQMIVHYSRHALGQHAPQDAHFSPIGGFDKVQQRVLIMDVDRVRHPSVWVHAHDLYQAMARREKWHAQPRGFFVLQAGENDTRIRCQGCHSKACHLPTSLNTQ